MEKEKTNKEIVKKKRLVLKKAHWLGLGSAFSVVLIAFVLMQVTDFIDVKMFYFVLGIAVVVAGLPFFLNLVLESRQEEEKETMFLEFSRDLVENVRSGTSISKSITNLRSKNYGVLNPYINKLANQVGLGIPVNKGLDNFAKSVKSRVISRAVTLIQEAERAGGKIGTILESVASSVGQIEKLRKERKAAVYNLTVQGYIVFLIFIVIMLIMQFKILPITQDIGMGTDLSGSGFSGGIGGIDLQGGAINQEDMAQSFLYLLLVQGFFAGIVIGKISEGSMRSGLKHSFILVALALLISTGANAFLGA